MAFHPKTLLVMPNPFSAIDHKGRPAGAFPMEDENPALPAFRHVGATKRIHADAGDHLGDLVWDFATEPVRILNTQHHKHGVMHATTIEGAQLIAADIETAKECGIAPGDFKPWKEIQEATKKAALARWQEENDGATALDAAPVAKNPEPDPGPAKGHVVPAPASLGRSTTAPSASQKAAE